MMAVEVYDVKCDFYSSSSQGTSATVGYDDLPGGLSTQRHSIVHIAFYEIVFEVFQGAFCQRRSYLKTMDSNIR